ncbi:hypothetical protein BaRGS_00012519, partial [Batillaria attramentaria]
LQTFKFNVLPRLLLLPGLMAGDGWGRKGRGGCDLWDIKGRAQTLWVKLVCCNGRTGQAFGEISV